jgi:hypothetical protein
MWEESFCPAGPVASRDASLEVASPPRFEKSLSGRLANRCKDLSQVTGKPKA